MRTEAILPKQAIVQQAKSLFLASGYTQLQQLRCESSGRVLQLRGTVHSFHMKQVAQELCRRIDGIQIDNKVQVEP